MRISGDITVIVVNEHWLAKKKKRIEKLCFLSEICHNTMFMEHKRG